MLFSPQIASPEGGENFNLSQVTITWDKNDPPSTNTAVTTDSVTYEIEYTDDYKGRDTTWYALKRRIPWENESYTWIVGKMIKSSNVRIRMRAYSNIDESRSDYSMSNSFAINIFNLMAPAIISPIPNILYTDYLLIILDETLTINTYHQKIRYTIEYSSEKREVDWTIIVRDIPVGQNVVRWNLDDVETSDDYIIRVTAQNSTDCLPGETPSPHQIARSFAHDVNIQQSGMFLIDTKPPEGILEIEGSTRVTNQLEQIVNIFVEDETTEVEQIQMRECDATSILSLGDLADPVDPTGGCDSIETLLEGTPDFDRLIGKPVKNNAKIQWVFDTTRQDAEGNEVPNSGTKKIEALLTDTGGNTSIQEAAKVFISSFDSDVAISDFIIVVEQRDNVTINKDTTPPSVIIEQSIFEIVYLGTTTGQFWALEPFSRLIYTLSVPILLLIEFNNVILIFAYDVDTDVGSVYRHDIVEATLLHTFSSGLAKTTALAIFNDILYIGFNNGELWSYNGSSFSQVTLTTTESISALFGDERYLYIGFVNSSDILLYNGTSFVSAGVEV